jgi:hypothetical protein
LVAETPRPPTQADHGPSTGRQHEPAFRQSRSRALVEKRCLVTTVTS